MRSVLGSTGVPVRVLAVLACAALTVCAGCAGADWDAPVLTSSTVVGDVAMVSGVLAYDATDACFVLEVERDDGSVMRSSLVWPPGTTARVTADGGEVRVPGSGTLTVGAEFEAAGGSYALTDLPGVAPAPPGCFSAGETEYVGVSDF